MEIAGVNLWRARHSIGAGLLLIGLLHVSGCGSGGPPRKTCFPVRGQLFVADQPADGAMIYFQPQDGSPPEEWTSGYPRARVAADGSFEVSTYADRDGAPAGDYVLLVQWIPGAANDEGEPSDDESSGDRLGGRFMDPASSPLRAIVGPEPTTLERIDVR
ncbi:MAG TPA: hypothetical protein VFV87_04040 [Pirellulaceae bacterium]|nr:hypothetical protein [Pirellulaceae bacterium]